MYQWAKTNKSIIEVMYPSHECNSIHVRKMKLFTFWIEYYCVGFLIEELNSRFQGRGQVEMHFKVFLLHSDIHICIYKRSRWVHKLVYAMLNTVEHLDESHDNIHTILIVFKRNKKMHLISQCRWSTWRRKN